MRKREQEQVKRLHRLNQVVILAIRLALDIAVKKPKELYDIATLKKASVIGKKLGINWGGEWKSSPDMRISK